MSGVYRWVGCTGKWGGYQRTVYRWEGWVPDDGTGGWGGYQVMVQVGGVGTR